MNTITANRARTTLYKLLDKTAASHEPILITGRRNNTVLISEEDWFAIQETMYLLSIPGMRKSIINGIKTPVRICKKAIF